MTTGAAWVSETLQQLAMYFAAFTGLLLLASAGHKLFRGRHARSVIQEFAGVPRRWSGIAMAIVVLTELAAAVLLWTPAYRGLGAAIAAVLWVGYLLLILRAIAGDRRDVDCGCSFGAAQTPLGVFQVVRNIALAATAVFVAVVCAKGAAGPIIVPQVLAALALLALYGALDQVMGLQPPRAGEMS